jgi:parvulin-like peptidyl-prolyl isomerase
VLLLAVGLLAVVGAGCDPTSPYAAKVNGNTISQSDLNNELTAIRDDPAYLNALQTQIQVTGAGQHSFNSTFVANVLNGQIVFQLVHQEVTRLGIKISGQDLAQARADLASTLGGAGVVSALRRSYQDSLVFHRAESTALAASVGHVDLSPSAIAQYYTTHQQSFVEQCVSHILVADQATAGALRDQIVAGASFADVARSQSLDKATGANGGVLGCGPTGRFTSVPAFEQAVNAQPTGQVSQPVQIQYNTQSGATQTGWDLILVTSRPLLPVEQATPQIRASLLSGAQSAYTEAVQRAASRAHITVNPRYGTYDPQSGQIVAPAAPPQSTLNFVPTTTTTTPSPFGP